MQTAWQLQQQSGWQSKARFSVTAARQQSDPVRSLMSISATSVRGPLVGLELVAVAINERLLSPKGWKRPSTKLTDMETGVADSENLVISVRRLRLTGVPARLQRIAEAYVTCRAPRDVLAPVAHLITPGRWSIMGQYVLVRVVRNAGGRASRRDLRDAVALPVHLLEQCVKVRAVDRCFAKHLEGSTTDCSAHGRGQIRRRPLAAKAARSQRLGRCGPAFGVPGQQRSHPCRARRRELRQSTLSVEAGRWSAYPDRVLHGGARHRRRHVRPLAEEQHVREHSHGPHVHLTTVAPLAEHLRSHVRGCAADACELVGVCPANLASQAEVA
mmetsp:Transcript_89552/g.258279  ORF Transcript_89552/g.258279 Transcript_89552/m.258279 type:complete len:329 (+) Transcript_89552:16-1002(+)